MNTNLKMLLIVSGVLFLLLGTASPAMAANNSTAPTTTTGGGGPLQGFSLIEGLLGAVGGLFLLFFLYSWYAVLSGWYHNEFGLKEIVSILFLLAGTLMLLLILALG